jgi:hypothetical protein
MAFDEAEIISALGAAAQQTSIRLRSELKFSDPGETAP